MDFRERLFRDLVKLEDLHGYRLEGTKASELARVVRDTANACCEIWGHDNRPVVSGAGVDWPGGKTIAMPEKVHDHVKCERCGRST
jgi:hypothetical protein